VSLLLAAVIIAIAAVVQRVSGVGGGFIAVPLLAMIDITYVPGAFIFATLVLSTPMAWQERQAIDYHNVPAVLVAFIPGAVAGAWSLSIISPDRLGLVFGSVILLAVLITASGVHAPLNRKTGTVAGLVAGVMGGSSGIGAPVLALLYHRQSAPTLRATLALLYTCCSLLILIALGFFGGFGRNEFVTGLWLMPGFVVGYVLGSMLVRRPVDTNIRPLVLVVSALAAVALIIKSL